MWSIKKYCNTVNTRKLNGVNAKTEFNDVPMGHQVCFLFTQSAGLRFFYFASCDKNVATVARCGRLSLIFKTTCCFGRLSSIFSYKIIPKFFEITSSTSVERCPKWICLKIKVNKRFNTQLTNTCSATLVVTRTDRVRTCTHQYVKQYKS